VVVVAQLPSDQVTAREENQPDDDEDWQEVHECQLVVVSEKCNEK